MNNGGDPRDYSGEDISYIDFNFVEQTNDKKAIRKAYNLIKRDGSFIDLERALRDKLASLDPDFKRMIDDKPLTYEEQKRIDDEMASFLNDAKRQDEDLLQERNRNIFSDKSEETAKKLEEARAAENERYKGNEFLKARDYDAAISCYNKSLALFGGEAATYCNRAMAYIKKKDFRKAVDDCTLAIELKPDYVKAYYRKGKALASLERLEEAAVEYQKLLQLEPGNKTALKELQEVRGKLGKKGGEVPASVKPSPAAEEGSKPSGSAGFSRMKIEEDEDEKTSTSAKKKEEDAPKRMLIEEVDSAASKETKEKKATGIAKQEEKKTQKPKEQKKEPDEKISSSKNETEQNKKAKAEPKKDFVKVAVESESEDEEEVPPAKQSNAKPAEAKVTPEKNEKPKKEEESPIFMRRSSSGGYAEFDEVEEEPVKTAQPAAEKAGKEKSEKDRKEKEEQDRIVQELSKLIEKRKGEAGEATRKGNFDEAIEKYGKCIATIESYEDAKNKNGPLQRVKAPLFNNIAYCYKQKQETKRVIDYASRVIAEAPFLAGQDVLAKAYLRRGLAYEESEKFTLAAADVQQVRQLQPNNIEATKCLQRVQKALAQEERERRNAGVSVAALEREILAHLDAGKARFQKQDFEGAASAFGEGIVRFEEHADLLLLEGSHDLQGKVANMYTNRCLANFKLGRGEKDIIRDAGFVLQKLDSKNQKALFRKAVAHRTLGEFNLAIRELQELLKLAPTNDTFKKELNEVMPLFIEQQKKDKEAQAKGGSKIQEVSSSTASEEVKKETPSPAKEEKKGVAKKTPKLNEDLMEKASKKAAEELGRKQHQVPKTSYAFESQFNSLQKEPESLQAFLRGMPEDVYLKLYAKSEIPADVFIGVVRALRKEFKNDSGEAEWYLKTLQGLAKTANFDMVVMFLSEKEKSEVTDFIGELEKGNGGKDVLDEVKRAYK